MYIIVYQEGPNIRHKIERICDSFNGKRFELPELGQIRDSMAKTQDSINNAKSVWMQTKKQLRDQLEQFDKLEPDALDRD